MSAEPKIFAPSETPDPLTVADIVRLYLRHSEVESVHCPDGLADRRRTLGLFAEAHGRRLVSECKPFHLADWVEEHASWRSVSTRRSKANQVRAAFQWAAEGQRIERNPFASVRYKEAERRPDLPDAVLDRVLALANKPYERALRFLRLTGCRLSELCEAVWADVDLERALWIIPRHKSRRFTGKPKVKPLVAEAVELLRRLRSELPAVALADAGAAVASVVAAESAQTANIFLNTRGTPWDRRTLGQQLRRMKARHGIETPASLHGIRHRSCSAAIAAGAPIKLVAEYHGHASCAVTERFYCDLTGEIDAIRKAGELGLPKRP